jgi:hypothetical protein
LIKGICFLNGIDLYLASQILILGAFGIVEIVGGFFYFYGTYLSFSISRALAVPIFRSRALWNGLMGLLLLIFSLDYVIGVFEPAISPAVHFTVYFIILPLLFASAFLWIDRTINVMIQLDPLRRDLLSWRSRNFRTIYWIIAALSIIFYFLVQPELLSVLIIFEYLWFATFVFLLGYFAFAIKKGRVRILDAPFRAYANWLLYFFVIAIIVTIVALGYSIATQTLIEPYFPPIVSSFAFYRMARSLVPLNKITLS